MNSIWTRLMEWLNAATTKKAPKRVILQGLKLDENGHPRIPFGDYYHLDSFYGFRYIWTPPAHDQNHLGHISIIGLRHGETHAIDAQFLVFHENGIITAEIAKQFFLDTLADWNFEVIVT